MIVTRLIGGLGNQMFQYAVGRRLALKLGVELKLDISGFRQYKKRQYELKIFNILENIASDEEIRSFKKKGLPILNKVAQKIFGKTLNCSKLHYKEKKFNFDRAVLNFSDNTYLAGYWQSEKYFQDISQTIRKDFYFKYPPDSSNEKIIKHIDSTNSVSIHIRRGDYASCSSTKRMHGVCEMDYYNRALQEISRLIQNPHFFIFTNDPNWTQKKFTISYPFSIVDQNYPKRDYEDMRLMSYCKHHIIANSTFSWWAAWLNNKPGKIVYAPKRWFVDTHINASDLLPKDWKKI
jgi:hypothetical protein